MAGPTMRAVVNYRGARAICLALVAGLVAFEAGLVVSSGAIGIPGLLLVRVGEGGRGAPSAQGTGVQDGGETVVTKLPQVEAAPEHTASIDTIKGPPAPANGEPNLSGLADEPSWDREQRPEPDKLKAFAADSGGREVLPWDAIEPVPFDSDAPAATAKPVEASPAPPRPPAKLVQLPESREVVGWVKAKATEIKGEDYGRPLFHFELWLEPPEQVKQRLVAVSYDFNTPAIMPQSQISSEQRTGFRIRVGGLACADKIVVTLRFNDGQSQQVAVDGCRLLG